MIRSSYSRGVLPALCLAALLVPVAAAGQQAADTAPDLRAPAPPLKLGEDKLPPIPPPAIHEFSSAERIPPENPDAMFAAPGGEDALPGGPADGIDAGDSAAEGANGSAQADGAARDRNGRGGTARDDDAHDRSGLLRVPLALPDAYLDPSWPDIRPPLRAERRQQRLEAADAEREQAASGKASDAKEETAVPLADKDLYMKEEHEDTWDEDFKDADGNPTDVWDPNYEDPTDW